MAQISFTVEYDFLIGLFKDSREDAFAKIGEAIMNQAACRIEAAATCSPL